MKRSLSNERKNRFLFWGQLIILLLALLLVTSIGNRYVPPVPPPIKEVSNPIGFVNITLMNLQSVPTVQDFDQLLKVNWTEYRSYLNANLSNVRFFNSTSNGASHELCAWIENNNSVTDFSSNVWVNLSNTIVPAHGTANIYMFFIQKNASWDKYWGLESTLTTGYGAYDNGANVFSFYDNFAGNSLDASKWFAIDEGSASYSVNNGISITGTYPNCYEHIVTQKSYSGIFQAFLVSTGTNSWGGSGMALDAQLPGSSGGYWGWFNSYIAFVSDNRLNQGSGSRTQIIYNGTDSGLGFSPLQNVTGYMSTLDYNGISLKWENYFMPIVSSSANELAQRYHMELWVGGDLSNTETATYQFARIIPPLPNDVMPAVSISVHTNSLSSNNSENGVIAEALSLTSINIHASTGLILNVSGSKES